MKTNILIVLGVLFFINNSFAQRKDPFNFSDTSYTVGFDVNHNGEGNEAAQWKSSCRSFVYSRVDGGAHAYSFQNIDLRKSAETRKGVYALPKMLDLYESYDLDQSMFSDIADNKRSIEIINIVKVESKYNFNSITTREDEFHLVLGVNLYTGKSIMYKENYDWRAKKNEWVKFDEWDKDFFVDLADGINPLSIDGEINSSRNNKAHVGIVAVNSGTGKTKLARGKFLKKRIGDDKYERTPQLMFYKPWSNNDFPNELP